MRRKKKPPPYTVEVVDGVQYVNGKVFDTVIRPDERRVTVTNPNDLDRLAQVSFNAGIVTRQIERDLKRLGAPNTWPGWEEV